MHKERKKLTTLLIACLLTAAGWLAACTNDEAPTSEQTFDEERGLFVIDDGAIEYNTADSRTPMSYNEKQIGQTLGECSTKMLSDYSSDSRYTNTVLSPMTVAMLYSMMANFTDDNTTNKQNVYKEYLGLGNYQNDDINSYHRKFSTQYEGSSGHASFSIKGDMWLQKNSTVYQSFVSTANSYHVGVEGVDFNSNSDKDKMNSSVQNNIGNADTDYLPSNYNDTKTAITASVSFSQEWEAELTESRDYIFHNADGTSTTCNGLSFTRKAGFAHFNTFEMVEIPYKGRRFMMYLVLPHENASMSACLDQIRQKGLASCIALSSDAGRTFHHEGIINNIDTLVSDTIVQLSMPALKLNGTTELYKKSSSNGQISQLYQTNLTKVSPNGFKLNNIYQACDIELSSKGTQASAKGEATVITDVVELTTTQGAVVTNAIIDRPDSSKGKRINQTVTENFTLDRPFALFIRDTATGGVPFAATINTMNN